MYTLGIDLHKRSSLWILIDEQKTEILKETVLCHPRDINIALKKIHVPCLKLKNKIASFKRSYTILDIFLSPLPLLWSAFARAEK